MNKSLVLSFFLLVLIGNSVSAQNKFWRGTVGLTFGANQYNGEAGNDFFAFKTMNPHMGLSGSFWLSPRFDLVTRVSLGGWGYKKENDNSFHTDLIHTSATLKVKLLKGDKPRWLPYVFGGIGMNSYSNWSLKNAAGEESLLLNDGTTINADEMSGTQLAIPVGVGVQVQLADRIFLSLDETYILQDNDNWDGYAGSAKDGSLLHRIGISFGICPWADTDKDGVSDKDDKCPGTPPVAKVDAFGCPLDADNDGIADWEDECPNLEGVMTGKGCPDADADGFIDNADACPSHAGIAQFNGCPDTDGDGVKDDEDECPSVKGEIKFNGCIDSDKDGIADPLDKCPGTPVNIKTDQNGCPVDTDADGIPDHQDLCPEEVGVLQSSGCPPVKPEVWDLLRRAATEIKFEKEKANLKPESFAVLYEIAEMMNKYPQFVLSPIVNIIIVRDFEQGQELSGERCRAIQKYLADKGVASQRLQGKIGTSENAIKGSRTKSIDPVIEFYIIFPDK